MDLNSFGLIWLDLNRFKSFWINANWFKWIQRNSNEIKYMGVRAGVSAAWSFLSQLIQVATKYNFPGFCLSVGDDFLEVQRWQGCSISCISNGLEGDSQLASQLASQLVSQLSITYNCEQRGGMLALSTGLHFRYHVYLTRQSGSKFLFCP